MVLFSVLEASVLWGYLALVAELMYVGLGATWANIVVGILSAIVDNIPVMLQS